MDELNAHCRFCGHAYPPWVPWPRTCDHCGRVSYLNPAPVAVTLVPVDNGLLVVQRGIEPEELAFPLHTAVVQDYFNGRRALPGAT